ncbi:hypothetical protein FACS189423_11090 [Bacteroidia bacterium]|nr:hypothetical protein FACS189423_11090 [Bacteroidia bacterium]
MKKTDSPFKIENLEEDSGFLMLQTSRLWQEKHERVLKRHYNLSHMQYAVLASVYWLILHSEKEVTQTILARHTKIDPMTISQVFKVLEKKNYIFRQRHSTDVRANSVFLTEQGKELMKDAVASVIEVDTKFFQVLGKNIKNFNKELLLLLKDND